MILAFIIVVIFASAMFMAAFKDATTMTIPNWISLFLIGGFFAVIPFMWPGWTDFGTHLLVGLTFFLAGFAMFAFGWLGGGDAKLMAATGLWWQWVDASSYILTTTLLGAALAIFLMLGRKFIPASILQSPWAYKMFKDEKKMPYGIALAAGALITLPQSQIFLRANGL